ncbi:MAG: hypothetical protein JW896_14210 [Deltaproteobacteria bacterium]|nr:hypothetical protein [Deltaproteobacteria bacterium]
MPNPDNPISRSIEEKIAWAETCYQEKGGLLLRDEKSVILLNRLKEAVRASRAAMVSAGVADECKTCEEREGGSCCGAGLEDRYDATLLLINLLLGIQLPKRRSDPSSCLFLGPDGCLLMARQVICVNYLCKKIENRVNPSKISVLRDKEGVELECLFLLHERIQRKLKAYVPG